jgi:hypothetical protein
MPKRQIRKHASEDDDEGSEDNDGALLDALAVVAVPLGRDRKHGISILDSAKESGNCPSVLLLA